jgi:hypothetical protein
MQIRPAVRRIAADLSRIARDAMLDSEYVQILAPYRHQHPECLRHMFLSVLKKRLIDGTCVFAAVTDKADPGWNGTERLVG